MAALQMKMLAPLVCLIVCCSATRMLENDAMIISPQNPSAFNPNLNLAMATGGTPDPDSKTGLPCEEAPEMKSWSSSAINATQNKTNELEITLEKDRTLDHAEKGEEVVYNVLPKGGVTPSGPSPKGNAGINGQGLSRSMPHRQDQSVSNKRILGSSPSKGGAGH